MFVRVLLVVVVCLAPALCFPQCVVSDWGPWQHTEGQGRLPPTKTYPLPVTREWDAGRTRMTETMKLKRLARQLKLYTAAAYDFSGRKNCANNMAGECECWNIDQLSFLGFYEGGLGYDPTKINDTAPQGNDIWGWTDPVTGDEYAIMGTSGGTSFVRITDPVNPEPVAFLYTETDHEILRDIKTIGNFAYIGAESTDHRMQIFDLTRLRHIRKFNPDIKADAHYDGAGFSHNIVANEETEYIYIVGAYNSLYWQNKLYDNLCDGGLHAVDVSDPLNPRFAGCYGDDGYTHDAQCVVYRGPDARYYGKEICFAFNEDSLTIVDVSNKEHMYYISKIQYEGVAYSHQGWITDDQSMLLLDDELDEMRDTFGTGGKTTTLVWDIRDLQNPVMKNIHRHYTYSADHNMYIIGNLALQANYEAGLRIMHIDHEKWDLREVGYFDVYPEESSLKFKGSWSVYPYFKSGTVVISSIDYGLFVLRPDYDAIMDEVKNPSTQSAQTRLREIISADKGAICPGLTDGRAIMTK